MIEVENLTKWFDKTLAVDRLSFRADRGEILGLLGPNGAGKTTTMRILTCYLPPSSGKATINGLDVFEDSLKVRQIIGYLPESVPLYNDMRVVEYLKLKAGLHNVPAKKLGERLAYVFEKCRIADVSRRIIGQLSKGYRQRVGLAAALIHDPVVLILDEPTVGLDPNQIRETRELIKGLGRDRTILLSTHILPEVEAVCQRVAILDKGKLIALDTPENLVAKSQGGSEIYAEVRGPSHQILAELKNLDGVLDVRQENADGAAVFHVQCGAGIDLREKVSQAIVKSSGVIRELRTVRMRLEDIFVKITTSETSGDPLKGSKGEGELASHQAASVS